MVDNALQHVDNGLQRICNVTQMIVKMWTMFNKCLRMDGKCFSMYWQLFLTFDPNAAQNVEKKCLALLQQSSTHFQRNQKHSIYKEQSQFNITILCVRERNLMQLKLKLLQSNRQYLWN